MNIVVAQEVVIGRTTSFHSVLWITITFAVVHIYQDVGKMSAFHEADIDKRMRPKFP